MKTSVLPLACAGLLLLATTVTRAIAQAAPTAPPRTEDQPVQLSAFEVSTDRDTAYRANNAVSSNRANTSIFDTPQSISWRSANPRTWRARRRPACE